LPSTLDGCKRHKVQPGIHCGAPAYAKKAIATGFTFVTVGGDTRFLTTGTAASGAARRDAPTPGDRSSPS
jgi:2-keto-3-deoxy-L-rhamnonate aldolase RhmA